MLGTGLARRRGAGTAQVRRRLVDRAGRRRRAAARLQLQRDRLQHLLQHLQPPSEKKTKHKRKTQ